MNCTICGISADNIEDILSENWTLSFFDGNDEHGPLCPSCSETLLSIADPSVLMSKNAMAKLKTACEGIEKGDTILFDETVQAIRSSLQAGLKVLFLTGAFALLFAFLLISTIPRVPIESED